MKTNTAQHTPGPWRFLEFAGDIPSIGISVGNDSPADCRSRFKYWIADVPLVLPRGSSNPGAPIDGVSQDEVRANARLIAEAPALVEALRAITARIEGEWDNPALVAFGPLLPNTDADVLRIAGAALRKAGVA